MLRSTTSTTIRSISTSPDSDDNHLPHNGLADCVSENPGEQMANGHQDEDDDSDCVSIIDCQMVNGDGPQHADPEYYFDEESGQIIHFPPNIVNGNGSTGPASHDVRVGNDTFNIRFLTDAEVENFDSTSDDADDPLNPRALYQCDRCADQFARSYQLKRHTFVEHNQSGAAAATTNGQNVVVITAVKQEHVPLRPDVTTAHREPPVPDRYRGARPNQQTRITRITAAAAAAAVTVHPPSISMHPNKIAQRTPYDGEHIACSRLEATDVASGQRRYTNQYKCRLCGDSAVVFDRLADIDEHMQLHNGTAFAFRCELCDEQLASLAVLQNHVHAHTCIGWPLRCQRCEQRFASGEELRVHWCAGKKLLACLLCRLTFAGWPLLTAHQEWVHAGRRHFRCNVCSAAFVHRTSLGIHRRLECKSRK